MTTTCDAPWPGDEKVLCQKPSHPYGVHHNMMHKQVWEGIPIPDPVKKGGRRKEDQVKEIIDSIDPVENSVVGPPQSGSRPVRPTRRPDPQTSYDAAASTTEEALRRSQMDVLHLFGLHGAMTDEVLIERASSSGIKQSTSGLRTRRSELVNMGYLTNSGEKSLTHNGRATIVWSLVRTSSGVSSDIDRHSAIV